MRVTREKKQGRLGWRLSGWGAGGEAWWTGQGRVTRGGRVDAAQQSRRSGSIGEEEENRSKRKEVDGWMVEGDRWDGGCKVRWVKWSKMRKMTTKVISTRVPLPICGNREGGHIISHVMSLLKLQCLHNRPHAFGLFLRRAPVDAFSRAPRPYKFQRYHTDPITDHHRPSNRCFFADIRLPISRLMSIFRASPGAWQFSLAGWALDRSVVEWPLAFSIGIGTLAPCAKRETSTLGGDT